MSNDNDEDVSILDDITSVNPPKETAVIPSRDPITGQFLKGCAPGPGRPKGLKDKLNVQVISTLEKIWASRGDEVMEHLASTKPEVLAGLVARLIPQDLATQAINGDEGEKAQGNQEVTIRLVSQVADDPALPAREVEGELLPVDSVDTSVH
jgi:hypothetical protein